MIYLASKSPRRRELLQQIQLEFECVDVDIPEHVQPGEPAEEYVRRIALEKAQAGYSALQDANARVLGADTTVVIDDQVLGKPKNREDALQILRRLSGRTHQVLTAVALIESSSANIELSASDVTFREITDQECERYWKTGEPADKAGAYAIQGLAALFVQSLRGSYSGVMGLPLYETGKLLSLDLGYLSA